MYGRDVFGGMEGRPCRNERKLIHSTVPSKRERVERASRKFPALTNGGIKIDSLKPIRPMERDVKEGEEEESKEIIVK